MGLDLLKLTAAKMGLCEGLPLLPQVLNWNQKVYLMFGNIVLNAPLLWSIFFPEKELSLFELMYVISYWSIFVDVNLSQNSFATTMSEEPQRSEVA